MVGAGKGFSVPQTASLAPRAFAKQQHEDEGEREDTEENG